MLHYPKSEIERLTATGMHELAARRHIRDREILRERLMDRRLGTAQAWQVLGDMRREMAAIEQRRGHMSDRYASKLGEVNAARSIDTQTKALMRMANITFDEAREMVAARRAGLAVVK